MELKDLNELNLSPDVRMFMEEFISNRQQFAIYSEWLTGRGLKVFIESDRPRLSLVSNPDPSASSPFYFSAPMAIDVDNFGDNFKILDTIVQPEVQSYRTRFLEQLKATVTGLDKPVKVSTTTTDMQAMVAPVQGAAGRRNARGQNPNPFWGPAPQVAPQVVQPQAANPADAWRGIAAQLRNDRIAGAGVGAVIIDDDAGQAN